MNENQARNTLARDYSQGAQQAPEERAIALVMTQLASALGDLETAARALAGRISPLLPAGSPFERAEKVSLDGAGSNVPQPVRSQLCQELHGRVYALHSITANLNQMVKAVEI